MTLEIILIRFRTPSRTFTLRIRPDGSLTGCRAGRYEASTVTGLEVEARLDNDGNEFRFVSIDPPLSLVPGIVKFPVGANSVWKGVEARVAFEVKERRLVGWKGLGQERFEELFL